MNEDTRTKFKARIPLVLSIAGSDPSGGAGIQGDIKALEANGVFAMTVLTSVTAQNTRGVSSSFTLPISIIKEQFSALSSDFTFSGVKTGMLSSKGIVRCVAEFLKENPVSNFVLDPVLKAKDGTPLLHHEAIETLKKELVPLSTLLTPNIPEAELLVGKKIKTIPEMEDAAKQIIDMGCETVLIKGGHFSASPAYDLLYDGKTFTPFDGEFINTPNTHGTGCTYASAICAQLAKGKSMVKAISTAKSYITEAIRHGLPLGSGNGPTNHFYFLDSRKYTPFE